MRRLSPSPVALSTFILKSSLLSSLLVHKLSHSNSLLCITSYANGVASDGFGEPSKRETVSVTRGASANSRAQDEAARSWNRTIRVLVSLDSRLQTRLLRGLIINSLHACLTLLGAFSIMFCSVGFVSIPGVIVYHHLSYRSITY